MAIVDTIEVFSILIVGVGVPSVLPSFKPSPHPSLHPTIGPSVKLTPAPSDQSLAPLFTPSVRPSLRPSLVPSASPTLEPTIQTAPVLSFTTSTTLAGLLSPELDDAAQSAIINATASSMGIDSQYVIFTGSEATAVDSRRLAMSPIHQLTVTYRVVAHTDVVIPMAVYTQSTGNNITDAEVLYTVLTSALNDAVDNGAYLSFLSVASVAYGAVVTMNVASIAVEVSTPTIVYPPSYQPTKAPSTSNSSTLDPGALAGIVIGAVVVLLIVVVLVWFGHTKGKKVAPASSSPPV